MVEQATVGLKEANSEVLPITEKNLAMAYKFLLMDRGVVFIIDSLPRLHTDTTVNIVRGNNKMVFLQFGKIYALITDTIIEHLKKVMSEHKEIIFSFAQSQLEEYEIKMSFSFTLDHVNCATLISLCKIANG